MKIPKGQGMVEYSLWLFFLVLIVAALLGISFQDAQELLSGYTVEQIINLILTLLGL